MKIWQIILLGLVTTTIYLFINVGLTYGMHFLFQREISWHKIFDTFADVWVGAFCGILFVKGVIEK